MNVATEYPSNSFQVESDTMASRRGERSDNASFTVSVLATSHRQGSAKEMRFDIPVTNNTRVASLIREVAEFVLPAELDDTAQQSVQAAIFCNDQELPADMIVATLPPHGNLYFYYGEALARRGGRGCEMRPYVPNTRDRHHAPSSVHSGVSGSSRWNTLDYDESHYRGFDDKLSSAAPSVPSHRRNHPLQAPQHYVPITGARSNGRATPQTYSQTQQRPPSNSFSRSGLQPMNVNQLPASKPSTAPTGNPWGFEKRGHTYRIPIKSTSDAPFSSTLNSPTSTEQRHSQQFPTPPQSVHQRSTVHHTLPPQNTVPQHQPIPPQGQPQMMMRMDNNSVVPVMMVMPFYPGNNMYPGYQPMYGDMTAEKRPAQMDGYPQFARPPSMPASESKMSRSQRFFGGSQPSDAGTFVSEPREAQFETPVHIQNTARRAPEAAQDGRRSPVPSPPVYEPRKLDFDTEEHENEKVTPQPAVKEVTAISACPVAVVPITEEVHKKSTSPEKEKLPVDPEPEEVNAAKEEREKSPSGPIPENSNENPAKEEEVPVEEKEQPTSPQPVVNVVSTTVDLSPDYLLVYVELPKDVDRELVCGLGDNTSTAITVGRDDMPNPDDSAIDGLPQELIRRLRVHKDTPVGTIRELLNITRNFSIVIAGQIVEDELLSFEQLDVHSNTFISFAEVRKRRDTKRRTMVLPPAFLSAMQAAPAWDDGSAMNSLGSSIAREYVEPRDAPVPAPAPASVPVVSKQEPYNRIQVVSPKRVALEGKTDSKNATPRVLNTTVVRISHDQGYATPVVDTPKRDDTISTPYRSATKPPRNELTSNRSYDENEVHFNEIPTRYRSSSAAAHVISPGVLKPEKDQDRNYHSSRLDPLQGNGEAQRKDPRNVSSAPQERTIDMDEYSSASHSLTEEEAMRLIAAARNPPSSSRSSVQRRRSSVNVSHQVTQRRQRVKRPAAHALTVATADDSLQHSEIDDSVLLESEQKRKAGSSNKLGFDERAKGRDSITPPHTLYTFKRREAKDPEHPEEHTMLITIADPKDPEIIHRDVPVDKNCPVSILKAWLLRDGKGADGREVKANIYYRGELISSENERMTFKTVTEFLPNGVFSFGLE